MKKLLYIFVLVILSMSLIISCDNANKTPESSTSEEKPSVPPTEEKPSVPPTEENPEVPPTEEVESKDIVILDFLDVDSVSSRGLTTFPTEGNPFFSIEDWAKADLINIVPHTNYGFWMSCNVMRSLPIFPGLKSVNANAEAFVNSIKNKNLKGYGFPLKVVDAKKTNDGVYIIYNVLEDGEVNGRIEYYYSTVEKKFSYREIAAPLFGLTGGDQIFVFEMYNVPVEKAKDGYKFKAGKLYDNGSEFRHVSFLSDTIGRRVQNLPLDEIDRFNVEDSQLVMNYNGNKVTSMEYEKYISNKPISETNNNSVCVPLNELTGGSITKIDVSNRVNALKFDKQIDFLKIIFDERSFAFKGYDTLSDFNNSSLEYLSGKQDVLKNYTTYSDYKYNGIGFPLSYDLDKNIGACLYNNNGTVHETHFDSSSRGGYSFPPFVLDKFKKCFGIEDEITSYDQFVQFMFEDLELSEYAVNEELRKGLLPESYNHY